VLLSGGVEPIRGGAYWKEVDHLICAFEEDIGTVSSFLFLSLLPNVMRLAHLLYHMLLLWCSVSLQVQNNTVCYRILKHLET
jgi:hypothetical protein